MIDPLEVIDGCSLEQLHEKVRSGNLPAKEVTKALADQKADFPKGIPSLSRKSILNLNPGHWSVIFSTIFNKKHH